MFHNLNCLNNSQCSEEENYNSHLQKLIEQNNSVFFDHLPDSLPPSRGFDHEMKIDTNSSPRTCPYTNYPEQK